MMMHGLANRKWQRFFFHHRRKTKFLTYTVFYSTNIEGFAPGVKRPECDTDYLPLLYRQLQNAWNYT
jgi:hypothetical protein